MLVGRVRLPLAVVAAVMGFWSETSESWIEEFEVSSKGSLIGTEERALTLTAWTRPSLTAAAPS